MTSEPPLRAAAAESPSGAQPVDPEGPWPAQAPPPQEGGERPAVEPPAPACSAALPPARAEGGILTPYYARRELLGNRCERGTVAARNDDVESSILAFQLHAPNCFDVGD